MYAHSPTSKDLGNTGKTADAVKESPAINSVKEMLFILLDFLLKHIQIHSRYDLIPPIRTIFLALYNSN